MVAAGSLPGGSNAVTHHRDVYSDRHSYDQHLGLDCVGQTRIEEAAAQKARLATSPQAYPSSLMLNEWSHRLPRKAGRAALGE
jgi:hypothetical protein